MVRKRRSVWPPSVTAIEETVGLLCVCVRSIFFITVLLIFCVLVLFGHIESGGVEVEDRYGLTRGPSCRRLVSRGDADRYGFLTRGPRFRRLGVASGGREIAKLGIAKILICLTFQPKLTLKKSCDDRCHQFFGTFFSKSE